MLKQCSKCEGYGYYWMQSNKLDLKSHTCEVCEGKGYVLENELDIVMQNYGKFEHS